MGVLGTHCNCIWLVFASTEKKPEPIANSHCSCVLQLPYSRHLVALPQNRSKRILWLSWRMVSFGFSNNWRSLSWAFCVHAFHSNHFWYDQALQLHSLANWISGPRFALVTLWYLLTARPNSKLPKFVAFMGIFRTLTCGGWTYVTSTDDHDWHDIFMISYLVATLPWTLGCLALSPNNFRAVKYRKYLAGAFFGTLVPLIYFFIQHKVHKVAGGKISLTLSRSGTN